MKARNDYQKDLRAREDVGEREREEEREEEREKRREEDTTHAHAQHVRARQDRQHKRDNTRHMAQRATLDTRGHELVLAVSA